MQRRYALAGCIALAVIVLDQITKVWIRNTIAVDGPTTVIPGWFNLVYVLNKGASFGFLNDPNLPWALYFLIGATILAIGLILHLLKTVSNGDTLLITGLGCILGGAVGNLIDRLRLGEVVDFLDFHWRHLHWPAFNVADIAISIGSCALVFAFLFLRRVEPKQGEKE